jgi:serine/threonine protein kinase
MGLGSFEEEEAKFYIAEVMLAVEFLHQQGYIHRDIKPNNFVFSVSGHLKLIDFGLSQDGYYSRLQETMRGTRTGLRISGTISKTSTISDRVKRFRESKLQEVVGSPDYIAPEVLAMNGYNFTVDWWAVGCILFEMLFGYAPFNDEDAEATLDNVRNYRDFLERPSLPDDGGFTTSDEAWNLVMSFLCEPENRLGKNGLEEIKKHPFFDGFDWDNILEKNPPFVPKLQDEADTSYFDPQPIEENDFMLLHMTPPNTTSPNVASPNAPSPSPTPKIITALRKGHEGAPPSPSMHFMNFTYNSVLELPENIRAYRSPRRDPPPSKEPQADDKLEL